MNQAQLINQDSGNVEYYTPPEIIEAARATMGSIDFDPFSSDAANQIVKATMFWGKENGDRTFTDPWNMFRRGSEACIWMNHP